MKSFWVKCTVVIIALTMVFSFGGCSKGQNDKGAKVAQTQLEKDKLEIQQFVKEYYESEIPKDEEYLKGFFVNPSIADIQTIKKKFSVFSIEKIKFNGVYNVKKEGRLAAMTGSFNAYFKSISTPRPDVEIVILIKKNNKWYFLNDDSSLNENELMWENNQKRIQNKFIVSSKNMNKILETNKSFDEANKDYMNQCKNKFLGSQGDK
ncbi:hypothetical protein ACJDT4_01505 [Clostridium neuense]|uniref:DUF4829 domain-containing protein n=1 Tax=Clostridium neuense TaxID=1728934 RepID=A0ABW8T9A0_9CLOT